MTDLGAPLRDLIPARYVTLHGAITAGGMQTLSYDVVRDRCTIHLHTNTGGIFVELHTGERFYVSASAVSSVELHRADDPDLGAPLAGLASAQSESASAQTQNASTVPGDGGNRAPPAKRQPKKRS